MRRSLAVALAALSSLGLAPLAQAAPGGVPGRPGQQRAVAADPPLSIDADAVRRDAVDCVDFPDAPADADAVVLVHGTFTEGHEQYGWNHELRLTEERLPHCVVTYPHRGQGDMQVSAEYVVVAVQEAARLSRTGEVDLVGHSQGALMPRWAVKYWPSVQATVDDFVLLAGPNHGTWAADVFPGTSPRPPVYWQFRTDSAFVAHVNAGDETPGDVDYTSVYAYTDELVQPSGPNGAPTAALHVDDPAKVVNVSVQDACPGRLVDHLSLGTTDRFVLELTIDALRRPGPADVVAVASAACTLPDQYLSPEQLSAFGDGGDGPGWEELGYTLDPESHVTEEPAIRGYATADDPAD